MYDIWIWIIFVFVIISLLEILIARQISERWKLGAATFPEAMINKIFGKGTYGIEGRYFARPKKSLSVYFVMAIFVIGIIVTGFAIVSGQVGEFLAVELIFGVGFLIAILFTITIMPNLFKNLYIYSIEKIDGHRMLVESLTQVSMPFTMEPVKPEATTLEKAATKVVPSMKFFKHLTKMMGGAEVYRTPVVIYPKVIVRLQNKKAEIEIIEHEGGGFEGLWMLVFKPKFYRELDKFVEVLEKKVLG